MKTSTRRHVLSWKHLAAGSCPCLSSEVCLCSLASSLCMWCQPMLAASPLQDCVAPIRVLKVISSQQTDWRAKELLSISLYSAVLWNELVKGRSATEKETRSGHQHEDRVGYKAPSLRHGAVPVVDSVKGKSGSDGETDCPSYKVWLLQHRLLLQEDEDIQQGSWCFLPVMVALAVPAHLAEEGFAYTCCARKSWSNSFQQTDNKDNLQVLQGAGTASPGESSSSCPFLHTLVGSFILAASIPTGRWAAAAVW